jgi:hypothetical protein
MCVKLSRRPYRPRPLNNPYWDSCGDTPYAICVFSRGSPDVALMIQPWPYTWCCRTFLSMCKRIMVINWSFYCCLLLLSDLDIYIIRTKCVIIFVYQIRLLWRLDNKRPEKTVGKQFLDSNCCTTHSCKYYVVALYYVIASYYVINLYSLRYFVDSSHCIIYEEHAWQSFIKVYLLNFKYHINFIFLCRIWRVAFRKQWNLLLTTSVLVSAMNDN